MTNLRITVACPSGLKAAANQLAMCLAEGPPDGNTYGGLNWQDADGNLYAAASFDARPEWITATQSALVRPAWDTDEIVDMPAAATAQSAIVFWTDPDNIPAAIPTKITAVAYVQPIAALAAMGLTEVDQVALTEEQQT